MEISELYREKELVCVSVCECVCVLCVCVYKLCHACT
jgi:hypothetical protein